MSIKPKQEIELEFNLSSVCNLSEAGTYRIMLKREMFMPRKNKLIRLFQIRRL